jgi:hypothetical protein
MAARSWRVIAALLLLTAGCAAPAPKVKRIVLFAPFESTYREAGYDALYPVKLALADEALPDIQLLSVDDGGSIDNAILRAQGLAEDPSIYLTLAVGSIPIDSRVLTALQDIPVVVIGDWNAVPDKGIFILASDEIRSQTTSQIANVYEAAMLNEAVGSEIFGLKSFAAIAQDTSDLTVLTSARPPSPEFRERLLASDLYVPEPGLLATVAYDAGTLATRVVSQSANRADVLAALRGLTIEGINGEIRFNANGYWADAAVYEYRYINGVLTPVEP